MDVGREAALVGERLEIALPQPHAHPVRAAAVPESHRRRRAPADSIQLSLQMSLNVCGPRHKR